MLNQKGSSLIGVIVAAGIMGILTLVMMDLNVMMIKNNASAQANSDILSYVNQLRVNLQDPQRATTMLAGNKLSGLPVTILDPVSALGLVLAKNGSKQQVNDNWSVNKVFFDNVQPGGAPGLYRLTVVLLIDKDSRKLQGPNLSRRVIGDVYCFAPVAQIITTCTGPNDPVANAKLQCQALGGLWNDLLSFGNQCQIKVTMIPPTPTPAPSPTPTQVSSRDDDDRRGGGHSGGCDN